MTSKAASFSLDWDWAQAQTADASQEWILAAMHQHGPALVSLLWRILGNEEDVCDAYQTVFLQLAHNLGGRKPDNVKAYLFRTASNAAISLLRKKQCFHKHCIAIARNARDIQEPDCAEDLDTKHLQESLREYIARLPEYLRTAVILRDLAEQPYEMVAKIMGVSVASARVYRCRAVQVLAAWMMEKKDKENENVKK